MEKGFSLPKIISEHSELVKLFHINRSGPVFLRYTAFNAISVKYTPVHVYHGRSSTHRRIGLQHQ